MFVDQSYWQSAVASKPKQGVLGLLLGGLAWFAIPFSFSTTMGLAYVALSAKQGEALLTPDDVDAGNLHLLCKLLKLCWFFFQREQVDLLIQRDIKSISH